MSENQAPDFEVIEEEGDRLDGSTALEAVDRAAIDIQVATAHRFPRDVTRFKREAMTWATLDAETAGSMFYVLPKRDQNGKKIEGPSVRLSEIVASAWGNLRVESDIVSIDDKHVTAMGTCFDLERNVAIRTRVKKRITDKEGKRYKEDMIVMAANAAGSTAMRNAIFKVVPRAMFLPIYLQARRVSIGTEGTMEQKRTNALKWFADQRVSNAQVFKLLGRHGVEAMTEDDLVTLRGIRTAIEEGTTSIEEAFGRGREQSGGAKALQEKLEAAAGAEKPDGDGGKETSPVAAQDHPVKGHKDKAGATVRWTCPCGFDTTDADKADAHRDGLDS